jgi:hypothetical protein
VAGETRGIRGSEGPPPERALSELAARQWGVVSLAQLRALGLSSDAVERRARSGRLHRMHRGVYAVGHTRLGREGRWLAAVLAYGPGAVLSHRSAASHWDLLDTQQTRIDVTAPRGRHGTPGIRLHTSRSLDARDTTSHEAVPITTVARTLLDLAATARSHELERALAQAMYLRVYDHRAITAVVARSNGHRGTAVLTQATALEPKVTRSRWEVRMLKLVRDHGLPVPLTNEPFHAPDHGECKPDFHWPAHRLIVETDGWHAHGTRAAFESDRAKDAALTAAGFRVVRFTWLTEDATIVRRLKALLHD